jgi:hypothetical protein
VADQQNGASVTQRATELFRWRQEKLGAGVEAAQVPSDDALWIIAGSGSIDEAQIVDLELPDRSIVMSWAQELVVVLRGAFPDAAAATKSPPPPAAPAGSRRRDALTAWRARMLAGGTSEDDLPPMADLQRIAESPARSPREIGGLPLRRILLVRSHAKAIAEALAAAEGAVGSTAGGADSASVHAGSRSQTPPEAAQQAELPTTPHTLAADGFVQFQPTGLSRDPVPVTVAVNHDGSLRYSWMPPRVEGVALTRVVYRDDTFPRSPDRGRPLQLSGVAEAIDDLPLTGPCRYVEVWVHVGSDEESAHRTQPFLHARTSMVAPVRNCSITPDGADVTGSWDQVHRNALRVEVHRIPLADLDQRWDGGQEVCGELPNADGFTDVGCPPGEYEYQIGVWAIVEGNEKCSPLVCTPVTVTGALQPVLDLVAEPLPGRDNAVSLTWTAPSWGEVRIYRTAQPARPGSEDAEMDVTALPLSGLNEEDWPRVSIRAEGTRRRISSLAVGDGAEWVVFTPVTIGGSRARIGRNSTHTRTGALDGLRIVERVDFQILTFGWPAEAERVEVYVTKCGSSLPDPPGEPIAVLTADQHHRRGGVNLERGRLNRHGCAVHVVPAYTYAGRQRFGMPVTVEYPGLMIAGYQLRPEMPAGLLGRMRRSRTLRLEVQCTDDLSDVRVVLVHGPTDLPLSEKDGIVVAQRPHVVLAAGQPTPLVSFEPPTSGWLRVFVVPSPGQDVRRLAVIDPPPSQLRCTP